MKHEAEKDFCPLGNIPNLHRARELVQCPSCPFPFAWGLWGQPWPSTEQASPVCNEHVFSCTCVLPDVCAGMHILLGTKSFTPRDGICPNRVRSIAFLPSQYLVTESLRAITICFVGCLQCYRCCVDYSWYWRVSFTWIQAWGWDCSGVMKYLSAADLGVRMSICNTERAAVEKAQWNQYTTKSSVVPCWLAYIPWGGGQYFPETIILIFENSLQFWSTLNAVFIFSSIQPNYTFVNASVILSAFVSPSVKYGLKNPVNYRAAMRLNLLMHVTEIQNWKESYTWIIIIVTVPYQKYFETITESAEDGILKTSVVKSFWTLPWWS